MRRQLRVALVALALVACALGVAALMAPASSAAGGGGGGQVCGGITGIPCPAGFVCVPDPRIDCVADCTGICKRKR